MAAVTRTRGYANTDFRLVSQTDLASLAQEFAARGVSPLFVQFESDGLWYASFETDEDFDEPLTNLAALLDAIESLTEPFRTELANCRLRDIDVGFDAPAVSPESDLTFPPELLARIVGANATLRVTVYAAVNPPAPSS